VQLQVRHIDKFVERHEDEWPLARTHWTKLYLDPARGALEWNPVTTASRVEYQAQSDGVTFMSTPLEAETEITGPVALNLFLASSTSDADVFATLRVFAPDGSEVDFQGALDPHTPVGQGWLRASHRKIDPELSKPYRPYHTHDEARLLTPGQVYQLDVEIWPTCIVVPAGYRIALTVQGKDFERAGESRQPASFANPFRGSGPFTHTNPKDRPPEIFDNTHTLHSGGAHDSYLLLPIIPARK
jgi:predicted acyl esterase